MSDVRCVLFVVLAWVVCRLRIVLLKKKQMFVVCVRVWCGFVVALCVMFVASCLTWCVQSLCCFGVGCVLSVVGCLFCVV